MLLLARDAGSHRKWKISDRFDNLTLLGRNIPLTAAWRYGKLCKCFHCSCNFLSWQQRALKITHSSFNACVAGLSPFKEDTVGNNWELTQRKAKDTGFILKHHMQLKKGSQHDYSLAFICILIIAYGSNEISTRSSFPCHSISPPNCTSRCFRARSSTPTSLFEIET